MVVLRVCLSVCSSVTKFGRAEGAEGSRGSSKLSDPSYRKFSCATFDGGKFAENAHQGRCNRTFFKTSIVYFFKITSFPFFGKLNMPPARATIREFFCIGKSGKFPPAPPGEHFPLNTFFSGSHRLCNFQPATSS
jgi:hypothetical protein